MSTTVRRYRSRSRSRDLPGWVFVVLVLVWVVGGNLLWIAVTGDWNPKWTAAVHPARYWHEVGAVLEFLFGWL